MGKLYGALLDLLFPSFCSVCGSFLFLNHRAVACKECWKRGFRKYSGRKCRNCGHPLELLPGNGELCLRCLKENRSFSFDGLFYYTLYEGLPEVAIRELKFNSFRPVAYEIGREVSEHLKGVIKEIGANLVVPVPVHKSTLRERGFNQTEEILKGAGVEYRPLLEKPFEGEKQSGLDFKSRRENVKGLFRVKNLSELFGKRVLLFDDVFTTGATADEISELLKKGGAEKVFVYTVAYTPLRVKNAGNPMALGKF
ncbi:MAG: ComF family protein [Desulfurobacteriaceae bacterium]